jgi:hypothetical protein
MGVRTWAVGFDATGDDVDPNTLNQIACAGQTASGFPGSCADDGAGNYSYAGPSSGRHYLAAGDSEALMTALELVAGEVCCGCLI